MVPKKPLSGLLLRAVLGPHGRMLSTTCVNGRYVRSEGYWMRDHKPGLFPKTKEDHYKAAIKYGVRPEDYAPMTKDHFGPRFGGNYPELGFTSFRQKDPYDNWSHDAHRRNFNEPVHWDFDMAAPLRTNFTGVEEYGNLDKRRNAVVYTCFLFAVAFGTFAYVAHYITIYGPDIRLKQGLMPKHYPLDYYRAFPYSDPQLYPIVNYSFEPADD